MGFGVSEKKMMNFDLTTNVTVEIEVNDEEAITRVTGPGGDEWRSYAYNLHTREDVLEHWAYNGVANGATGINHLDGWADMSEDAVIIKVTHVDVDTILAHSERG